MIRCQYCKESLSLVENYDKAITDEKLWVIHHRLETHKYKDRSRNEWVRRDEDIPSKELKALGLYYDRPANELIFMTNTDHMSLHKKGCKLSEDHKQKVSDSLKGKPKSEEHNQKVSESLKGKKRPEEVRRKIAKAIKGKHWKLIDGKRVYY